MVGVRMPLTLVVSATIVDLSTGHHLVVVVPTLFMSRKLVKSEDFFAKKGLQNFYIAI